MPNPKLPFALAKLRGSTRKNPSRYESRKHAPQPHEGLGEPPQGLSPGALQAWLEIDRGLPPGVLTVADRMAVELAAQLLSEFRENPALFPAARLAQLRGLLGSLGLTPVDRIRLAVPQVIDTESAWARLAAE